jgi:HEAT repeat protein
MTAETHSSNYGIAFGVAYDKDRPISLAEIWVSTDCTTWLPGGLGQTKRRPERLAALFAAAELARKKRPVGAFLNQVKFPTVWAFSRKLEHSKPQYLARMRCFSSLGFEAALSVKGAAHPFFSKWFHATGNDVRLVFPYTSHTTGKILFYRIPDSLRPEEFTKLVGKETEHEVSTARGLQDILIQFSKPTRPATGAALGHKLSGKRSKSATARQNTVGELHKPEYDRPLHETPNSDAPQKDITPPVPTIAGAPEWLAKYLDQAKDARRFQDTKYYVDGRIEPWHSVIGAESKPENIRVFDGRKNLSSHHGQFERISTVLGDGPSITILLGDPGTGKTTSLRRHLHMKALDMSPDKPSEWIPIYVDLTNSFGDPETMTCSAIKEVTGIDLRSLNNTGLKLTIMFDGVDRLQPNCDFQYFFRRILNHQIWAPHSRIVLTCKAGEWNPEFLRRDDVQIYKICPFGAEDQEEIAKYVEQRFNWCCKVPRQIAKDSRVLDMAGNPQLLAMMCDLLDPNLPGAGLPAQKAQLIQDWIKRKLQLQKLGEDWFGHAGEAFLRNAAYVMMKKGVLEISKSELEREKCPIPHYRLRGSTVLALAVDAGILASSGHTARSGRMRFIHQTFQEYFAAIALAEHRSDWLNVAMGHVYDPKWKATLTLLGSILDERLRIYFAALLRETGRDILMRPLHIAVDIASHSSGDGLPHCLIDRLRRTTVDYGTREGSFLNADHLATAWGETALPVLVRMDPSLRKRVLDVLSKIRGEKAEAHLLPLLKDKDPGVRLAAVEVSMAFRDRKIAGKMAEHLVPLLKDKDSLVRSTAAEALGLSHDDEMVEHLAPLHKDKNATVRGAAVMALGLIGSEKALKHLVPLLKVKDDWLREGVIEALGMSRDKRMVEHLTPLLKSKNDSVRKRAAKALGSIGDEKALKHLLPLLQEKDVWFRWTVAEALSSIEGDEALKHLVPLLKVKNDWLREGVVEALGMSREKRMVEHLVPLLNDKDARVRRALAEALGRIKGDKALMCLVLLLKDKEVLVRVAAAMALGLSREKRMAEHLMPLLKEKNEYVRRQAAESLGRIEEVKSVEGLVPLLKDKEVWVRVAAAEALGRIEGDKAQEYFLPLLKDKDESVREYAARALGSIGNGQAGAHLLPWLKDAYAHQKRDLVMVIEKLAARQTTGVPMTYLPEALIASNSRFMKEIEELATLCDT